MGTGASGEMRVTLPLMYWSKTRSPMTSRRLPLKRPKIEVCFDIKCVLSRTCFQGRRIVTQFGGSVKSFRLSTILPMEGGLAVLLEDFFDEFQDRFDPDGSRIA